ncbi:MAG: epimerase, partial [Pseudomonadota bacterium]
NAAEAFAAHGWTVRAFNRSRDDLNDAAQGADVIVNAWNPDYADWASLVPGLTEQVIQAAEVSGATVILPGNVYVFGETAPTDFGPDSPHAATNPLGRIRIAMEERYRKSGVQTILLRAGDFLDTRPSGNWFDRIIAAKARTGVFTYPGAINVPHAWAYLPDLASAAVSLAEMRGRLGAFTDLGFPGYTLTGQALADTASEAVGHPLGLKQMNWLPLQVARPFWRTAKHLLEMRYLWNKPHRIDGAEFETLLPDFSATPLPDAMKAALSFQIDPDEPVTRPTGK